MSETLTALERTAEALRRRGFEAAVFETAAQASEFLLADMPAFASVLSPAGKLILSGFYHSDVPLLLDKASALGLTLEDEKTDNDWTCLTLCRK